MNVKTGFDNSILRMNTNQYLGVTYGGTDDGSPDCRFDHCRWLDGWE